MQKASTMKENLFRPFFSSIKTQSGNSAISRVFITCILPFALSDFMDGLNIAEDIKHNPLFAELCELMAEELEKC